MKHDKNGYAPSIMQKSNEQCYMCGRGGDLARHEIFYGPNRKASKHNGFWISVCPECHNDIHSNASECIAIKRICQMTYEKNHSRTEFMQIVGRNYLVD